MHVNRSFVSHLEGAIDGTRLPAGELCTLHAGRPIRVRYDLEAVGRAVRREDLAERPPTMWRYHELLPIPTARSIVSLGETMTPLIDCPALAGRLGVERLLVKDESRLPTGSFKARGMAMAITMAKALGVRHVAVPTAGNAGGAAAAYAARAGLRCTVLMPEDTPVVNRAEAALFGADVRLVDGLISDCGAIVREGVERVGWFDLSTLKEPYRLEGKKTMGLELAEQLGWSLPGTILYPTGGGTGLIGMFEAFEQLAALGWLASDHRPRLYACQSDGCPPIVTAFERGDRFAEAPPSPHTIASGLRVPVAVGDFMILDAVRASGGAALAGAEASIRDWTEAACRLSGLPICPETAICLDAFARALEQGTADGSGTTVLFNTGAVQKYVEAIDVDPPRLRLGEPIDWSTFAAERPSDPPAPAGVARHPALPGSSRGTPAIRIVDRHEKTFRP